jgi:hypothetical protein
VTLPSSNSTPSLNDISDDLNVDWTLIDHCSPSFDMMTVGLTVAPILRVAKPTPTNANANQCSGFGLFLRLNWHFHLPKAFMYSSKFSDFSKFHVPTKDIFVEVFFFFF